MRPVRPTPSGRVPRRRGSILAAELLLVLPVLLLVVLGMLELGSLLYGRHRLTAACREGARVAAISGDPAEAERVVGLILGADARGGLVVRVAGEGDAGDARPGEMVSVIVGIPSGRAGLFAATLLGLGDRMMYARASMRRE